MITVKSKDWKQRQIFNTLQVKPYFSSINKNLITLNCSDRRAIPTSVRMLRGRFVFVITDEEIQNKIWVPIFSEQQHLDKMKRSLVQNIVVGKKFTTKLVVILSSTLVLQVFLLTWMRNICKVVKRYKELCILNLQMT